MATLMQLLFFTAVFQGVAAVEQTDDALALLQSHSRLVAADEQTPSSTCSFSRFSFKNIVCNNLGGQGPDKDCAEEIRYSEVSNVNGVVVDFVATTDSDYASNNAGDNGGSKFMSINIARGSSVIVNYAIVATGTNTPVPFDKFYLSILDFDNLPNGQGVESVITEKVKYMVSENSKVAVADDGGMLVFTSTLYGNGANNVKTVTKPKDTFPYLTVLNQAQQDISATLIFTDTASFQLTLGVAGDLGQGSRTLFFAGATTLVCTEDGDESLEPSDTPAPTPVPTSPLSCEIYVCPAGMGNKGNGALCAGEFCDDADVDTCCSSLATCAASSLDLTNIVCNNLGGLGPDTNCPQEMRYMSVAEVNGIPVDLVITNTSTYTANNAAKRNGGFGLVTMNLKTDSSVDLQLAFVEPRIGTPIVFDQLFLSVLELDHQKNGAGIETVTVQDVVSYEMNVPSDVAVSTSSTGATMFTSQVVGNGQDNPLSAMELSAAQKAKGASLQFSATSTVQLSLSAGNSGFNVQRGRNFQIAGASNIVCPTDLTPKPASCGSMTCPEGKGLKIFDEDARCAHAVCGGDDDVETCCESAECSVSTLSFESLVCNNLGGFGPDTDCPAEMRFEAVTEGPSGNPVDLVITTVGEYQTHKKNGNIGGFFAKVSIAQESSLSLNFALVGIGTYDPVMLESWDMSVLDIDQQTNGGGQEFVSVASGQAYTLSENSVVSVSAADDKILFGSTVFGSGEDNPRARELTEEQKNKAVTFTFAQVSQFTLELSTGQTGYNGMSGRFFHFAGASSLNCPAVTRALCSTMTCPLDMVPHIDHQESLCIGETCGKADEGLCCMSKTCGLSSFNMKATTLICNNLGGFGPDTDCPEEMRSTNVAVIDGVEVDLVVTASDTYKNAVPTRNGAGKGGVKLNIKKGVKFDATFSFYASGTYNAVNVKAFYFSILDLDNGPNRAGEESFTVPIDMQYELTTPTNISVSQDFAEGTVTFGSNNVETGENNVKNALELTDEQKQNSVALVVRKTSSFTITFELQGSKKGNDATSRNMVLAGTSALVCK